MFEKEAEEYFRENAYNFDEVTACRECMEFGYNKANEWHYVKDELDTKSWKRYNKYLVIARFTTEDSDIPLLAHFDYYLQRWFVDRKYLSDFNVIAWKEIVLPKESE